VIKWQCRRESLNQRRRRTTAGRSQLSFDQFKYRDIVMRRRDKCSCREIEILLLGTCWVFYCLLYIDSAGIEDGHDTDDSVWNAR